MFLFSPILPHIPILPYVTPGPSAPPPPLAPASPGLAPPRPGPVAARPVFAPPRELFPTMGASKPPNFSWVVEGRLAGLAMPREAGHYRYLREHGVRHLVSLTERAPPHHGCCPEIQLHRFRVPDFTPPSPEQIQSFLKIVEEANGRGEAVAVHCMLGHGRTGTLLACYLCKERHLAAGDAIHEIRRLRPGSIETVEQEQAVIRFCQYLQ